MPATPALRIELLGLPRLVLAQGRAHPLERRDAALLALLALHGPTPRNRVVALIWPDLPLKTAQTNLRQRLFRLKQRTGFDLVVPEGPLALAHGVQHDLDPGMPLPAAPLNADAKSLLGELDYEDCGDLAEWVAGARAHWRAGHRQRLAHEAARLEGIGRIADALAYAERLALDDPTAEHAHRRVMRLHYRRGDRAAALAAFERCRESLQRELGTAPGDETRALAALIERSGALPPPVAAPSPVAVLRPPRLIGRSAEWRLLEQAWQRQQLVLIRGEPGIGKSRLAADFAVAQNHASVHRAHPGDARMPYTLLARLLRALLERFGAAPEAWIAAEFSRLLPELGAAPAGKLEPLRLQRAFVEALVHWQSQGLTALVIDDLQFADEASLELLLAWLAQPRRPQLVLTVRAEEVPALLTQWLANQDAGSVCDLALGPLDRTAIHELLESLALPGLVSAAWVEPLARHTGGNPLFILETLMAQLATSADAPPSAAATLKAPAHIGKLLDRRLAQLPPEALRLARVAALAGADFSAELAARVLGVHVLDLSDAWVALEQAQVIRDGAFAHDLILEATLRSVPDAIARALHGAIANALEPARSAPARMAHHWWCAHDWARAAMQFEVAARQAVEAARHEEALGFWDAARDCHLQQGQQGAAFRVRCLAVDAAIVARPASEVDTRVAALLVDSTTDSERLDALLAQCKYLTTGSDHAPALSVAAEAAALARRLNDPQRELLAISINGVSLTLTGRAAEGVALFEAAAGGFETMNDKSVQAEFAGAYGHALQTSGHVRESCVWTERAAQYAEELGDFNTAAIYLGNLAVARGHLGEHERALELAERSYALHARLGEQPGLPQIVSYLNLGMFYMAAGRYGEGLRSHERGLALARSAAARQMVAFMENHVANVFLRLGQPAKARQTLTPLTPDDAASPRMRRTIVECRIDAYAKRPVLERLLASLEALGSEVQIIDRLALQLTAAAFAPAAQSLQISRGVRAEALSSGLPTIALSALAREADALRRVGTTDEAAAAALLAVAEAAQGSWHDIHVPEFWWLVFQALDAGGHSSEALVVLQRAADWVQRAVPTIPEVFRESYLHRSHVVPELLAMARRRLPA